MKRYINSSITKREKLTRRVVLLKCPVLGEGGTQNEARKRYHKKRGRMKKIFFDLLKPYIKYSLSRGKPTARPQPLKSILIIACWFIVGPILIIALAHYVPHSEGWQILIAAVTTYLGAIEVFGRAILFAIASYVQGAENALRNPPGTDETWVQITNGDEVIWKGEKITPIRESPTTPININLAVISGLDLPEDPYDQDRWSFWATLIVPLYNKYSPKKIVDKFAKEDEYKGFRDDNLLPRSRTTVTKIIKLIRAGKLPIP
jgi:hypothetical protein